MEPVCPESTAHLFILANLSNLWVCSGPLSSSEWSIWNEPCYLACFGRYLVLCRSELRDCGRFLQGPHNWVQWSTTLGVCFAARKKHRGRGTEHQSQQKTTCQQISWIWDLGANKSSSVMIRLHIPSMGHRSNFWSFLYSVVHKPCTEWSIHAGLCSRRCLPENLIEGWVVKYQKRLVCIWQNLAFSFPTPLGMKVDLRLTFHINLFSWKISKSEVGLPSWPNSGTVSMSSHVNTNLGHVVPKFQYSAWHPGSATHHRLYELSEPWVQIFVGDTAEANGKGFGFGGCGSKRAAATLVHLGGPGWWFFGSLFFVPFLWFSCRLWSVWVYNRLRYAKRVYRLIFSTDFNRLL